MSVAPPHRRVATPGTAIIAFSTSRPSTRTHNQKRRFSMRTITMVLLAWMVGCGGQAVGTTSSQEEAGAAASTPTASATEVEAGPPAPVKIVEVRTPAPAATPAPAPTQMPAVILSGVKCCAPGAFLLSCNSCVYCNADGTTHPVCRPGTVCDTTKQ